MKTAAILLILALALATGRAAEEPQLAEVVDFKKLLPILPEAPAGWTADKAEGSTDDIGGTKITSVHRDYKKGDAADAPTAEIVRGTLPDVTVPKSQAKSAKRAGLD